ncbi:hypothetical protein KAK07_13195 [Ideonella sp. 4Y16]|uniref:hypothetical protein n=1 Tax=Ideonella alba TaxID=2824118 RepID=UPI001B399D53|nr:hypothetical protein [Ideonella alba]MBQ0944293.1 hypothetical protein [Ideonella alba]
MDSTPKQRPAAVLASLREAPWVSFLQQCLGGVLLSGLVLVWIPRVETRSSVKLILMLALLACVALKYALEWPQTLSRVRSSRVAGQGVIAGLGQLAPPELAGLARFQWRVLLACLRCRRTARSDDTPTDGEVDVLARSSYPTVLAIVFLMLATEVPVSFLVLQGLPMDPSARLRLHLVLMLVAAASAMMLLGDRCMLRQRRHRLDTKGLRIQLGARTSGCVAYDAIAEVKVLSRQQRRDLKRPPMMVGSELWISPLDRPNLSITLRPGGVLAITHLTMQRTGLSTLYLYVSDPDAVKRLLDARLTHQTG